MRQIEDVHGSEDEVEADGYDRIERARGDPDEHQFRDVCSRPFPSSDACLPAPEKDPRCRDRLPSNVPSSATSSAGAAEFDPADAHDIGPVRHLQGLPHILFDHENIHPVFPVDALPASRIRRSALIGERPRDGSSSSMSLGRDMSARAMARSLCSPPESDDASCLRAFGASNVKRIQQLLPSRRSTVRATVVEEIQAAHEQVFLDRHPAAARSAPRGCWQCPIAPDGHVSARPVMSWRTVVSRIGTRRLPGGGRDKAHDALEDAGLARAVRAREGRRSLRGSTSQAIYVRGRHHRTVPDLDAVGPPAPEHRLRHGGSAHDPR